MKVVLTEWCEEGKDQQQVKPVILDLHAPTCAHFVWLALANGTFEIACFETDSAECLEVIRGALTNMARKIEPTARAKSCRLYRPGYEVYTQGGQPESVIFLNPDPRPELFSADALGRYAGEFASV